MPIEITSFESDNMFDGTADVDTIDWLEGDMLVVWSGTENGAQTLNAPTNVNLTFTQRIPQAGTDANDCEGQFYTATATTDQTAQTIEVGPTTGGHRGSHVWRLRPNGATLGIGNSFSSLANSAQSLTVGQHSVVCYALGDWNANNPPGKTPGTGSGTATERMDDGNGTTWGFWVADWNDTDAGTFDFGPSNFTSLNVNQMALEITVDATMVPWLLVENNETAPTAGSSDTASVSPTTGARVFVEAHINFDDNIDPMVGKANTTVSGLSGTWNKLFEDTSGNGLTFGVWWCDDWSGSGAVTIANTSDTIDSTSHRVWEITGASLTVPPLFLSRSTEGTLGINGDERDPDMTIGEDWDYPSAPTNAVSVSSVRISGLNLNSWTPVHNTPADWAALGTVVDDAGNHAMYSAYSATGVADPTWANPGGTLSSHMAVWGYWVCEAGNEPATYHDTEWEMPLQEMDDGDPPWTGYPGVYTIEQVTGSGAPTVDYHSQHAPPFKVLDMSTTGWTRWAIDPGGSGLTSDDSWHKVHWFQDKDGAGAENQLEVFFRMDVDDTTTADCYYVRILKQAADNDGFDVLIRRQDAGTGTTLASMTTGTVGDLDDAQGFYVKMVGSVISVYGSRNRGLLLTYDADGDATEYTTGRYFAEGQYREKSATDSQPFSYGWEHGTFATVGPTVTIAYYQTADMFTTGDTDVTGVSWAEGDFIVVVSGNGGADLPLNAPTNANLTFSAGPSNTDGGANEAGNRSDYATATSTETGQTIAIAQNSTASGSQVWVIHGTAGETFAVGNTFTSRAESLQSLAVSAGSVVVHYLSDWNASNPPGKTPATGSGTATERSDAGNGTNYAFWSADWVGTSATTTTFGPNNFDGLKVGQLAIEIDVTSGSTASALPPARSSRIGHLVRR